MNLETSARQVWVSALLTCVLALAAGAQDDTSPSRPLGDLARQTRTQHEAPSGQSSKAQQIVDEMQQEQEAEQNAPTGFKSYNAGEYHLFVPFPYSLEGRDNGGAVLLGSQLGITNTEVMAGTPIPIPPNLSDSELANMARQVALMHSGSGYCAPAKIGSRKAFTCGLSNARLLGHEVWGNMEIVVGSSSLIPIMCVSPDDLHQCLTYNNYGYQTCGNRYPSWEEIQRTKAAIDARYRDERTTAQMCEQIIYPSVQLREDIVVHPATISESKAAKTATEVPQDNSVAAYGRQTPSLGDLARKSRQTPRDKAQATLDNGEGLSVAPPGFQSYVMQYCQNPQHCEEASVVIPEKAEMISSTNGQHIFKAFLGGDPVFLYAGPADVNAPYRSLTEADYIRMRDLANSNGWSHEKADGVSTQELTIEGRPALMTRFRYQRDQKTWWIGERAIIEDRGKQFLVGCTAPEQRFADAELLCTTLVNSLRLP